MRGVHHAQLSLESSAEGLEEVSDETSWVVFNILLRWRSIIDVPILGGKLVLYSEALSGTFDGQCLPESDVSIQDKASLSFYPPQCTSSKI
jgi:hypothetical protein